MNVCGVTGVQDNKASTSTTSCGPMTAPTLAIVLQQPYPMFLDERIRTLFSLTLTIVLEHGKDNTLTRGTLGFTIANAIYEMFKPPSERLNTQSAKVNRNYPEILNFTDFN